MFVASAESGVDSNINRTTISYADRLSVLSPTKIARSRKERSDGLASKPCVLCERLFFVWSEIRRAAIRTRSLSLHNSANKTSHNSPKITRKQRNRNCITEFLNFGRGKIYRADVEYRFACADDYRRASRHVTVYSVRFINPFQ